MGLLMKANANVNGIVMGIAAFCVRLGSSGQKGMCIAAIRSGLIRLADRFVGVAAFRDWLISVDEAVVGVAAFWWRSWKYFHWS